VGGLEVLVDQAPPVHPAQRGREADGNSQEALQLQRAAEEAVERLATGVGEQQHRPALLGHQRQGLGGPVGIELISQGVFVLQPPEAGRAGALRHRHDYENCRQIRLSCMPVPATAEDEFPVLANRLQNVVGRIHGLGLLLEVRKKPIRRSTHLEVVQTLAARIAIQYEMSLAGWPVISALSEEYSKYIQQPHFVTNVVTSCNKCTSRLHFANEGPEGCLVCYGLSPVGGEMSRADRNPPMLTIQRFEKFAEGMLSPRSKVDRQKQEWDNPATV